MMSKMFSLNLLKYIFPNKQLKNFYLAQVLSSKSTVHDPQRTFGSHSGLRSRDQSSSTINESRKSCQNHNTAQGYANPLKTTLVYLSYMSCASCQIAIFHNLQSCIQCSFNPNLIDFSSHHSFGAPKVVFPWFTVRVLLLSRSVLPSLRSRHRKRQSRRKAKRRLPQNNH